MSHFYYTRYRTIITEGYRLENLSFTNDANLSAAGILIALNPLTSAVLGNIILGEAFGVKGLTGSVLIICGIMLPNILARSRSPRAVAAAVSE